jgi:superfamily II DNA or RNA helicase
MIKIIIHDNKTCQLITDDESIFRLIRSRLSYKLTGIEYTPAYKNGWNGITYLINKKGYFFYGLLNKVTEFLKDHHSIFELEDKRLPLIYNESIDLSNKLKELGFEPRDYQTKIMDVACKSRNGIIRAATGSGKSLIMALITAKLNKPTCIFVIGLDLLQQFHDLFSKLFDEKIGYIGNGICDIQRINIVSIWTIGSALNLNRKSICSDDEFECKEKVDLSHRDRILKLLADTKVAQFDECHIIAADTAQIIHKNINPDHIYGFSGTPYRDDNTYLLSCGILGEQIIDLPASELIEKKVLAQPIIKFISVPKMSTSPQYQTVYKEYITENSIRNNLIIQQAKELLDKKYIPLVLFKHIKHGQELYQLMLDAGVKCEMLYGNDSLEKRTEVKKMIENKEIDLILASNIFDIGVSIDILSALILAGGGKSSIRALQRIGRILRKYPGKTHVAVVDFYDQTKFLKKHSITRYNIYSQEPGFKIIKCKEMKDKY